MSEDVIVIRHRPGEPLSELSATGYERERELQHLLEDFPKLLAGADMNPASPRRFRLVSSQAGVPDHAEGGTRWKLDLLFLDQEAIPTLVELKLGTDTRIRREVAGQMLDYAANGKRYWGNGRLRAMFEETWNC